MRSTPRRTSRRRARALKSAMIPAPRIHLESRVGPRIVVGAIHRGPRGPPRNAEGRWRGPSHTSRACGGTASERTVASITPPARPRQPACAAATTSPESAANRTGRQSAVRIAHTRPGRRVTAPSAGPADPPSAAPIRPNPRPACHAPGQARRALRAVRPQLASAGGSPRPPLAHPRRGRPNSETHKARRSRRRRAASIARTRLPVPATAE